MLRVALRDGNATQAQIGKPRLVVVIPQIQIHRNLVNDGHSAPLAQAGKDFFCFIRAHIVVCQDVFHCLNSLLNDLFIVGTAILPQKKLKNIGGNIGPLLDFLGQVLAHNFAIKLLTQLLLDACAGIRI